ncbi:MAG: DUF4129 domain-containing protein [Treponema sp.]|nr:DUF4129 domain-containing protein [Candidatus Treponema caballi]
MNRAFLQRVLHRIFILFLSLAGSFTLVFCIRDALPAGFVKPLGITLLFITGLDIISMIVHDLFVSEKANGFTYIRYAVYLNIILILLIKFCKPIVSTGLIWIGTNLAVVLTYLIKRMFDLYETFCEHTNGMDGKELSSDLTENNWFVSDYINYAKKLIFSLFIISLVLCAFVLVLHIVGRSVSIPLYVSLVCFIVAYVGLIILHTVNDHETSFAFLGHAAIFNYRKHILLICILLCLISMGAGIILSSDTPLLRPEYFAWLLKGFPQDISPSEYTGYNSSSSPIEEAIDLTDVGNLREDSPIIKILHYFFIGLEYCVIAAIVIGIFIFMTNAFFGKKWKDFWKERKLSKLMKAVWMKLKQLIHDLLHMKWQKRVYNTVEAASFRDAMKSLLSGARKSKEKRAELDALTKKFMELVDFAASKGVSFKPHIAPLEFARLLENDAALTAGRLFEQALYAKELLTKEERAQFEESIQTACR